LNAGMKAFKEWLMNEMQVSDPEEASTTPPLEK